MKHRVRSCRPRVRGDASAFASDSALPTDLMRSAVLGSLDRSSVASFMAVEEFSNGFHLHRCFCKDHGTRADTRCSICFKLYKTTMLTIAIAMTTAIVTIPLEIMLDCLNNIAACHLRAKEFHQAKEAAVKVLSFDPDNLKRLVRAAKAALLDPASSYEEVEAAIAAAEMDHPDDSEVQKLRIELNQRIGDVGTGT